MMDTKQTVPRVVESFRHRPLELVAYMTLVSLAIVPMLAMAVLIIRYSVNVPWWDQLSFVDLMSKLHNGTLSFYDLWKQHNEHRIVFPQALELGVGYVTGFNFRIPVFLNLVTALGSFSLLVSLLHRTFARKLTVLLLAIPFSWLLFSPFQWVNWIWGFQLAFFLTCFFTILSIWLLIGRKLTADRRVFYLILLAATITTYCNGNGMLIWPIGLGIVIWRKLPREKIITWLGVAMVVIATYLYKFHRSADSPHPGVLIKEPVAVAKYALAYLGRNISTTPTGSRYAGFILLLVFVTAFVYVYKKGKLDVVISWVSIAAYVLLTALLAAASRLNQGVDHGFISNSYPTISLLFILTTIAMVTYAVLLYVQDFKPKKLKRYLTVFLVLGALVALPLPAFFENYAKGVVNFKDLGLHLQKVRDCVYIVTSADDPCLGVVYPDNAVAWKGVRTLKILHWDRFK